MAFQRRVPMLGGALKYFFLENWFLYRHWFGKMLLWKNIIVLFLETLGSDLKDWKGEWSGNI